MKNCPFCNGKGLAVSDLGDCWVICETCGAETGVYETEDEAIAAWNRRPSSENE